MNDHFICVWNVQLRNRELFKSGTNSELFSTSFWAILICLKALNEGCIWKKEKHPSTNRWKIRCSKNIRTWLNLSTGGCMICGKLKHHSFLEELTYKRLWAIVQIFLMPCMICTQRKVWFLLPMYANNVLQNLHIIQTQGRKTEGSTCQRI